MIAHANKTVPQGHPEGHLSVDLVTLTTKIIHHAVFILFWEHYFSVCPTEFLFATKQCDVLV